MLLVPPNIESLEGYEPGRPIEEVARELGLEDVVKLASNENPYGPSPLAVRAAHHSIVNAHRYPDAASFLLKAQLALRFGVSEGNIIVGSGSESIIGTILRTFLVDGGEILSARHTFAGFRMLARATGHPIQWIPMRGHRYDLPAMSRALSDRTKVIYVANPDNPTGSYVTSEELLAFLGSIPPQVLVIVDEAYHEFAAHLMDYPDSARLKRDNLITLRTFSKAHGLAGLRVGYGIAQEGIIRGLNKVRLPFEPSVPAQAAALAALGDTVHLAKTVEGNRQGHDFLRRGIHALGCESLRSAANFIPIELGTEDRAVRVTAALLREGVIVRPLAFFGWPTMIRVTIGRPDENERFLHSLRRALREAPPI